ncbi:uncharacterized protein G2W53_027115 [Senna tora]|uniref:Uncharacterized protein n=1 Tax=Senna tora TaxID=362788 RepID=A0A834WFR4_9FABA|nr:uncharacterized protein G2W53_027115 [Senna tora]
MGDWFFSVTDRRRSKSSSIEDLAARNAADKLRSTSSSIEDLAAGKSDCLETSWEFSLCHRLHFDPAYAREILHRKKLMHGVADRRRSTSSSIDDLATRKLDCLETSSEVSLCQRLHLTQHMHMRFCIEKELAHDSFISDVRRSTWSTARRPTRIAMKLLGSLPCVIGIILSLHMHRCRPTVIHGVVHRRFWQHVSWIGLKLLVRFPCVLGFILTQLMHGKKLTHDSLIFDGRRSTWLTAGRPTRITSKILGRLPCIIVIIFSEHMHVRFCIEKKFIHGCLIFDCRRPTAFHASSIEDLAARKSDCLESSSEFSLCHRLLFDPAYAPEILHRKKVDPRLNDF